jgi:hypothetical protein
MIPLVTAIEDLDGVLPDDVRITWSGGSAESRYALTLENERVSVCLQVESDALIQRGEAYRQFLACVAKVMAVMAPSLVEPAASDHRLAA